MARQQTAVRSKPHGTQWPSHRQLFISFPHQQRAGEAARAAGLPEGTPGAITGAAGLRNVDGMSDRGQGLNPLHVIGLNRVLKFVLRARVCHRPPEQEQERNTYLCHRLLPTHPEIGGWANQLSYQRRVTQFPLLQRSRDP